MFCFIRNYDRININNSIDYNVKDKTFVFIAGYTSWGFPYGIAWGKMEQYTKSGMLRHLAVCKNRKERLAAEDGKTKCGYLEVVISGKYNKDYWLVVEINENATLKELDKFIRDIWVECCGHLSMFVIDGVQYEVCPNTDRFWGPPSKSINYKLKDVFTVGETFTYEYDFGSTTELILNVHSYRIGERKKEKITILSRNNFWCEECLHEYGMEVDEWEEFEEYYGPDILLPVCNSPRMGICGYEGSNVYPDQFEPDEK